MKTHTGMVRKCSGAVLGLSLGLLPLLAFAVETDRITVEDPNTQVIKFKVTSDGNVTGASFTSSSTDGAAISIQQGPTEASNSVKLAIKDSSGVVKTALTPNGVTATGSTFPVGGYMRTTSTTGGTFDTNAGIASGFSLRTKTSGVMADGFGGGFVFTAADSISEPALNANIMASVYARRDGANNKGLLQFFTTGTNAISPTMTLRNSGDVGIGTTSPSAKLEVNGNIKATAFIGDGSGLTNLPAATGGSWGALSGTISNQTDLQNALDAKANTSSLSGVAISGSYNDLVNKPTIPSAETQSSILTKMATQADGVVLSMQQGPTEPLNTAKLTIMDSSGVVKTTLTPNGVTATGSTFPVGGYMRTTSTTGGTFDTNAGIASGFSLRTKTSGVMADGFGGGFVFTAADSISEPALNANIMASVYARRDGANDKGLLQFFTTGTNAISPTMTLRNSGNVGIGTTAPTQKLEVKGGGLRLNTAATTVKPPCDDTTRGTFWFTQGTTIPLNDKVEVCAYVSGTLDWKPFW